jgi:hypothetical protein
MADTETASPETRVPPMKGCPWCWGRRFWQHAGTGRWVCGRCHPPLPRLETRRGDDVTPEGVNPGWVLAWAKTPPRDGGQGHAPARTGVHRRSGDASPGLNLAGGRLLEA